MALDWPLNLVPVSHELMLRANNTVHRSPFTQTRRVLRRPLGDLWVSTARFRPGTLALRRQLQSVLAQLEGQAGTVRIPDWDEQEPLGTNLDRSSIADTRFDDLTTFDDGTMFDGGAAGMRVWGARAAGDERILVDGLPQNTTQLLEGDKFGVGGCLHILTADADADDLGRAYFDFKPGLRAAVAHRATITRSRPTVEMCLVDDDQGMRSRRVGDVAEFVLSFYEALPL